MTRRVQLAINVDDLAESIGFYRALFGAEPAKVRPGYANFAIADPPLKLILIQNPGQGGSLNHLGVEVPTAEAVDGEQRLAGAGLTSVDERDTTCCYARQDKFWVDGAPDGERWEVYTVLEDSPTFWGQAGQEPGAAEAPVGEGASVAAAPAGAQCCGSGNQPGAAGSQTSGADSRPATRCSAAGISR